MEGLLKGQSIAFEAAVICERPASVYERERKKDQHCDNKKKIVEEYIVQVSYYSKLVNSQS